MHEISCDSVCCCVALPACSSFSRTSVQGYIVMCSFYPFWNQRARAPVPAVTWAMSVLFLGFGAAKYRDVDGWSAATDRGDRCAWHAMASSLLSHSEEWPFSPSLTQGFQVSHNWPLSSFRRILPDELTLCILHLKHTDIVRRGVFVVLKANVSYRDGLCIESPISRHDEIWCRIFKYLCINYGYEYNKGKTLHISGSHGG
jgi:hypothetical protein